MPVISTIAAATARAFGAFKAAAGGAADEFFNYVTLLLHGDGTNGAQNNTFLDSSTNNFTITRNGNTTQGTFSPFYEGWSNYFDGSGDYLQIADDAAFEPGSGDFSVEAFIYLNALPSSGDISIVASKGTATASNLSWSFQVRNNSGTLQLRLTTSSNGTTGTFATEDYPFTTGQWYHIAAEKSGTTGYLYANGVRLGTGSAVGTLHAGNGSVRIGTGDAASNFVNGYVSSLRFVKGSMVYNGATYTVPTAPLTAISGTSLLTCQSNRFKDNSANNFAITVNGNTSIQPFSPFAPSAAYDAATNGGSGYFDGSGDYLSIADNDALDLSTGDFTIQGWVYCSDSVADVDGIIGKRSVSGGFDGWRIAWDSTNALELAHAATGVENKTPANSVRKGEWAHFAFTRSGTTLRCYANGVLGTSNGSFGLDFSNSHSVLIGTNVPGAGIDFPGYMTDIQIIKGTALYTGSTYTVPTSPATAVSGTSLLLNFTNAGILDNTGRNDLETVGNAQISTSVKKFGTGSLAFDGTTDYLKPTSLTDLAFGTGDFTIEFWLYLNTTSVEQWCVAWTGPNTCTIYFNSGTIRWFANGVLRITGASLSATTWYHIALARENGSTKLFVDGTQSGSTYADTNSYVPTAYAIGATTTGTASLNGYIDDLRITKGVARYTANFTPPTAAFEDQ